MSREVHRSKAIEILLNQIKARALDTIMLDSMKHIEICRTAVEVIEGENLDLDERLELKVGLKKHMELEIARAPRR